MKDNFNLRTYLAEGWLQKEYTEGWDETVAEHMWNTVLHWKAKKWITEEEADQIRDIIGA